MGGLPYAIVVMMRTSVDRLSNDDTRKRTPLYFLCPRRFPRSAENVFVGTAPPPSGGNSGQNLFPLTHLPGPVYIPLSPRPPRSIVHCGPDFAEGVSREKQASSRRVTERGRAGVLVLRSVNVEHLVTYFHCIPPPLPPSALCYTCGYGMVFNVVWICCLVSPVIPSTIFVDFVF